MTATLTAILSVCCLQAPQAVSELTADEKAAMQTISEGKIVSTISFLASDELAGRDTPSPELLIAGSYVAARFRGAGLEGLGPEGSFYQETTVDTERTPSTGVVFEGARAVSYGLLMAAEPVKFEGRLENKDGGDGGFNGPVIVSGYTRVAADARSLARAQSGLVSEARRLQRSGATAMLVLVEENSPLVDMARQNQSKARMVSRRRPSAPIPVLLVDSELLTDAGATGTHRLVLPGRIKEPAVVRNVFGMLRGSDPKLADEAILFSAHLDHIGRASGADTVNNGADDDASGVTSVLALADAYAALKQRPRRTVIFATYWGEEKGLLGSRYFSEHPLWPLQKIVANVNIEMVGRPEQGAANKSWMTGWTESDLGSVMAVGARRAGVEIFEHPRFSAMLYGASDNAPLVRVGVIAHSFSAGSLHQDYHQPGDEWEKLVIPHMTTVVRGLFAGSLPLAHGTLTPQKNKK